jgi:hypothetical protein
VKKSDEMLTFMRHYKREQGISEVQMMELAAAAAKQGWPVPPPVSGIERLAKQFAAAAREETRYDKKTSRPYRANLAYTQRQSDGKQLAFWIDTDEANRSQMDKAMNKYREQMLGEAVIGTNTVEHWNRTNPNEEPLQFSLDFTDETEWKRNIPVEEEELV